ncbi:hypothetical protein [Wolinella succinogenes]|nr:hypothetical protein [Wolinella succinogenes]
MMNFIIFYAIGFVLLMAIAFVGGTIHGTIEGLMIRFRRWRSSR